MLSMQASLALDTILDLKRYDVGLQQPPIDSGTIHTKLKRTGLDHTIRLTSPSPPPFPILVRS